MRFSFPFLEDASYLVTWGSGDLGEDSTLPPAHSGTLAKPYLLQASVFPFVQW